MSQSDFLRREGGELTVLWALTSEIAIHWFGMETHGWSTGSGLRVTLACHLDSLGSSFTPKFYWMSDAEIQSFQV